MPLQFYEGYMGEGMSMQNYQGRRSGMSMQTTYNVVTAAAVDEYFNLWRHRQQALDLVLNPDYKSRFLSFVDAVERRGNKIDG